MRFLALLFAVVGLLSPLPAQAQVSVAIRQIVLEVPFDSDAVAYFNRAGVTDSTAKKQINSFVRGIKSLGLWNSMVCWPLRSTQNAGTGTTAYSLGGGGTFNGTLVNGPTWGADGLDMNGLDMRVTTTAAATQPNTILAVFAMSNEALTQVAYDGSVRQHIFRSSGQGFSSGFAGSTVALDNFTVNAMFAMQLEFNGASGTSSFNGAAKVTRSFGTNNLSAFRMGSPNGTQKGCKMAFACIISSGSVPILYSLYKSTLGDGLGLP